MKGLLIFLIPIQNTVHTHTHTLTHSLTPAVKSLVIPLPQFP